MDELEIRHLLADKGRSTLVPPGWIGEIFSLSPAIEEGQSCSNRDQIRKRKESLCLQLLQLTMGYGAPIPLAFFWAAGTGGGAGSASHVGVVFPSKLLGFFA